MTMHNRSFVLAVVLGSRAYLRVDWILGKSKPRKAVYTTEWPILLTSQDESDDSEYLYAN